MKKLLFAVTALAALSLLAPSTGFAQGAHNQLGIYTDDAMTATDLAAGLYTQPVVYMVLSNPYSEAMAPIPSVGGIEFKIVFDDGLLTEMGLEWTSDSVIDIGNNGSHIAGVGTPLPVVDGVLTNATITYLIMSADPATLHLAPADPASIADVMVLLDGDEVLSPLWPSSGDFADPVFAFNGTAVATDNVQLDEIKALYR